MRSFFSPADGPSWLGQVLASIRAALGDLWDKPFGLWQVATTDLPAAADYKGRLVWNTTSVRVSYSDGTNWQDIPSKADNDARYAAIGSGVLSFNTRTGAVTLSKADVTGTGLAKADIGLGSVDNTADVAKNVLSATKLTTSRTLAATGDVTWSGSFDGSANFSVTATIATGAVTLAKMANMATASLIYRKTAGSGAPEVNTLATLKTDLGLTGTNSGDQTITLTGDVTGSGTGSFAATIAANAVTLAKMAQVATATILGRTTAATGNVEALTAAQARTVMGVTATGADTTYSFRANNLSDLASAATARTNLGLGTAATQTYTEGTYTASISFGGTTTGITYSSQSGRYTRVGRMCFVEGKVVLTNKGSATGPMRLEGLPFAGVATVSPGAAVCTGMTGLTGSLTASIEAPNAYAYIYQSTTTGVAAMDNTNVTNSTAIYYAVAYYLS